MPPVATRTAVRRPSLVAERSASPARPSVPALAIATRMPRPTALPTCWPVETMPEEMPCS